MYGRCTLDIIRCYSALQTSLQDIKVRLGSGRHLVESILWKSIYAVASCGELYGSNADHVLKQTQGNQTQNSVISMFQN